MTKKLEVTFYGGVGKVTGANFMLRGEKTNILVDCGLVQGSKICDEENRKPFAYDPKSVDFLFVTHSHIDHIGRIPKLVKDGFKGVIYSTPETKALAYLMLEDSLGVLGKEATKDGLPPIYLMEDVMASMNLWKEIPYHEKTKISDDFEVYFRDAGHILGSAMIEFTHLPSNGEKRKITFTGDLGNSPTPLLNDTEVVNDTDYIVMESVYGDRNHEGI
ncbi:MBL fold metallo-hydrolase, partial [Candidatus Nomurabacteria bacterium]|nr:MBL fold metallo-hydrolase [Candidatus Nomurabacteria bacterium]